MKLIQLIMELVDYATEVAWVQQSSFHEVHVKLKLPYPDLVCELSSMESSFCQFSKN